MTLADLRALCERSKPGEVDSTILLGIVARTWLPALIEVASKAHGRYHQHDGVDHAFGETPMSDCSLCAALARLDEVK